MSSTTSRLGLYLSGGGSSGKYGADETADVDRINDSLLAIDAAVGVPNVPDSNLPVKPYLWQVVKATTTDNLVTWNGSNWVNFLPNRLAEGVMASKYVTVDQLASQGSLDGRYYTQTQLLNGGVLDSRYQLKGNYQPAGSYLTSVPKHGQDKHDFKIAWGTATASGFNGPDGVTGRYQIGVPIVIPNGALSGASNVRLFGIAWSQDYGAVTVQQDPNFLTGPGGGQLLVNRRNDITTTISWFAVGSV